MNIDSVLKLQGGYRNTVIPYKIDEYKRKANYYSTRTYIPEVKIVPTYKYTEPISDGRTYNIVDESQRNMAMKYIMELRTLEADGKIDKYNSKANFIFKTMNEYLEPAQWVLIVYNYLVK
jgi:hypothetical protein